LLGPGVTHLVAHSGERGGGGGGFPRSAARPGRRYARPRDRGVRPAGAPVREPADGVPRAGAGARPRGGALDDLQRRPQGRQHRARFRAHGPRPQSVRRCRRSGTTLRALEVSEAMKAVAGVLVCMLVCGAASAATMQGSQPLRKTDVIRLLSNPLISKSEVAELIRRNCIAFRPTPRDWADLRDFGADAEVLSSLGGCTSAPAAQRPAPTPPLAAVLLPPRVSATVGTVAVARVQIKRGALPQGRVPVVLRGSAAIPGGAGQDAQATTDASGVAVFQLPVGRVPATYRLAVVTGSGATIPGTPPLEVAVGAAAPAAAEVQPGHVELRAGVDVSRADRGAVATSGFVAGVGQRGIARTRLDDPVVFQIRNSVGRPLAGKIVAFRAVNADVSPDSVVTDSAGLARVEVTLGKQAGPALVTATADSLQKQASFLVDPAAPVSVVMERDGIGV